MLAALPWGVGDGGGGNPMCQCTFVFSSWDEQCGGHRPRSHSSQLSMSDDRRPSFVNKHNRLCFRDTASVLLI